MQKIISLFQRNYDTDRLVRDEVVPRAEWVLDGEGVPTRKWDGTCCMVRDGRLFKRYELKPGKKPPAGFEAACDPDPWTGKQQGWLAVGDRLEDRWHQEAFERGFCVFNLNVAAIERLIDGTYELVGPKINRNPDGFPDHYLVAHGECHVEDVQPRSFQTIRQFLERTDIEGIVWRHPDGRLVKIKAKDFGINR